MHAFSVLQRLQSFIRCHPVQSNSLFIRSTHERSRFYYSNEIGSFFDFIPKIYTHLHHKQIQNFCNGIVINLVLFFISSFIYRISSRTSLHIPTRASIFWINMVFSYGNDVTLKWNMPPN